VVAKMAPQDIYSGGGIVLLQIFKDTKQEFNDPQLQPIILQQGVNNQQQQPKSLRAINRKSRTSNKLRIITVKSLQKTL
jgi:hypothetical protein